MCRGVREDWLLQHSTQIGGFTVDGNCNIIPKIMEINKSYLMKSRRRYHQHMTPSFGLFGKFGTCRARSMCRVQCMRDVIEPRLGLEAQQV